MAISNVEFPNIEILSEDLTPIDLWQALHGNAKAWQDISVDDFDNTCERIDESDKQFLSYLTGFPSQKWKQICDGVGWSSYGAIALSWCKGAEINDVLEAWDAAMKGIDPSEFERRPASFLNPELIPDKTLSAFIETGKNYKCTWLLLVAAKEKHIPLKQDLQKDKYQTFNKSLQKIFEGTQTDP